MHILKNLLIDRIGRRDDAFGWREFETIFPMDKIHAVCLLQTDAKLGDAIINSLLVDAFRLARPDIELTVGTTDGFVNYWERNPGVARVVSFIERNKGRAIERFLATRAVASSWRDQFDALVSFDSYAFFDTFALIDALRPKRVVGFNKASYRLFDISLDDGRHGVQRQHISTRIEWLMKVFGINLSISDLNFHVPFGSLEEQEVKELLQGKGPYLLFNTYGASRSRSLAPKSVEQALRILDWPGKVLLSVPRDSAREFRHLQASNVMVVPPLASFQTLFALVARVDGVISPDSAVAHIAAAFNRPQICLFKDRLYNPVVWRPMSKQCDVIVSTSGDDVNDFDRVEFAAASQVLISRWERERER